MSGTFSEKLLLYRLRTKHDPESYAKLYDAYVERIYRFVAFKVSTKEEAEDITSEVFLKAWNFVQENKNIKSFSGLLYRIARNLIIDLYRKKAVKPESSLEDAEEADQGDQGKWMSGMTNKLEAEQILIVLKKLKQEYQEVVTLKYVDELEIEEIAAIVGKSKVTVRVTLHRALKKLEELIALEQAPGSKISYEPGINKKTESTSN